MTSKQGRSDWLTFIRAFLRAPRSIGSIAPSSPRLVRLMLDDARIDDAALVLEFGPGTGVFTAEILRRLRPDARLLVVELNAAFFDGLAERFRDPRMTLIQGSAADIASFLEQHGLGQADCIVSGLPFTSLPQPVTDAILTATYEVLRPGGVFVTYQYTAVLWRRFVRAFDSARVSRLVFRNLPPALVFVGRKHDARS